MDVDGTNAGFDDTAVGFTAIEEREASFVIHVDLEDADPDEVLLDVAEDALQVFAPMEETVELEEAIIEKEGFIYRRILVPENADIEGIEFSTEDGHLDIILPKKG